MTTVAPSDLRRWSEEVALDPGAPAFYPLARAYRAQGRRDAAKRLCLRGLERNPAHVDAHALLALLHLEAGQRERAADEWAVILRLEPEHFEAHRGMGFYCLERDDLAGAARHLGRAAALRPADPAVREAMVVLSRRGGAAEPAPRDPAKLFEPFLSESPFLGALVVDPQGLVSASTFGRDGTDPDALGAALGGAVDEAVRTAEHLGLGDWRGLLLETETASIHIGRLGRAGHLVFAARAGSPPGWVLRTAERAAERARAFLGIGP